MFAANIKKLLNDNGWDVSNFPESVRNTDTGCVIRGSLVDVFIQDKINELLEEVAEENKQKLSDEEILKQAGYTIICESPFEIEDQNGALTTGECAGWVLHYLRHESK